MTEISQRVRELIIQDISKVDGITWQEKLHTLSRCNCCVRHQNNKPFIFGIYQDIPSNKLIPNYYHCHCKCRHVARFICRQSDDFIQTGQYCEPISRPPTPTSVIR